MTEKERKEPAGARESVFYSLHNPNYRLWAAGFAVSSMGTWMQRTAMDWLVLTQLSHNNASALGTVMALQFLPILLLLPITGATADRFDKNKILVITQICLSVLALTLGILTITGMVRLWQVYIFALAIGSAVAFDTPVRQSFISELVSDEELPNAVALNSASFSIARMIGPAIAGVIIARFGCGYLFVLNAISFMAVLVSLFWIKIPKEHLSDVQKAARGRGNLSEGIQYVWNTPGLLVVFIMIALIGTFGINFPIFISTMAVNAFHAGPKIYGFLASMMGLGAVIGAFLTAKRKNAGLKVLCTASAIFGAGFILSAFMPDYRLFGLTLIIIGIATQTFTATANSNVQLSTVPSMRGRIMSLFSALTQGSTPIGAPIVGFVADKFGPRIALGVGAMAGFSSFAAGVIFIAKNRAPQSGQINNAPVENDQV